jgi:uncharacterized damage-inducible protein DinB
MMATKKTASPFVVEDALIGAYATNNRINVYLVQNLPDEAWRAEPPRAKGRDIASMVAHIHNVRLMWLKAAGVTELPQKLDSETVTKQQAVRALEASWRALEDTLGPALNGDGRIKGFKPDVASFFAYLVAHDAHHRGQITMLARQVGHPVSQSVMFGLWEWGTR